ncbi:peptide chain release factor 2 [Sporosarcina saromensis]|uniref:Peptide chain release factor 2 n=1 Tax=Sporosarcina saromensis TaxID=359365 RepID=A0ABU4G6N4_9BACL|nr:peptide chain release factor 2 [Sporosarcina saromensis]MDW0112639.1 peptide chain release factor 2 [Sporosarcina saromensis]
MELSDVRNELDKTAKKLADFRGSLDLENKEARIQELDEIMLEPSFWDSQDTAQKVIAESNALKDTVGEFNELNSTQENLEMTLELLREENDEDLQEELFAELKSFKKKMEDFDLQMLLSDEYDKNNAILEIHSGAGGTESQDWASMLLRMYTRWSEDQGFKVETLDYQAGDEAGVKSVTVSIKGHNAYGYLKAEKGVHRLVRISPFDSSGRRHTSFSSVEVMPEFDGDVDVELKMEDVKVDTYRSSGAGGQHVNTTDSAVRMTHIPTGAIVTCQTERSQIKNRERAINLLKAKIYQLRLEEEEARLLEIRGEQKEIGWGSQIRSYVFHPYSMVKDHRTNEETGNVGAVMDGEIDIFINAYLRSRIA